MSIDLATLDASEASEATYDLEITHPTTDEPLGIFIQIIGYNSRAVQDVVNQHRNEALKKSFEAQRKTVKPTSVAEIDRKSVAVLAAATVGWYTVEPSKAPGKEPKREESIQFGATRVPFSRDEAEKIYLNPGYGWLTAQVDKAIIDLSLFMKAS